MKWGLGFGDWGLGIGDWGLGPIPNPQYPIPNPQINISIYNFINLNNLINKKIQLFKLLNNSKLIKNDNKKTRIKQR